MNSWFDVELKSCLGIDIFDYPFGDADSIVINKGNINLLVLKTAKDRVDLMEKAISSFLDMPEFRLKSYERSTQKYYGNKYDSFLDEVCLPDWYIDMVLNSEYAKHFGFDCDGKK